MTLKVKNIKTIVSATRQQQRELGIKEISDTLIKADVSKITVREGFNVRTHFEGLDELADSMEQEGQQEPISVDILPDGTIVLTDGERRYRASLILQSRSKELKAKWSHLKALLNPKGATETDRVVKMLSTQSREAFDPIDEANGYQRLKVGVMGEKPLSITEISKRVGKPIAHVESRLLLLETNEEERQMVADGKTTVTALTQLVRKEKDPVKRVQKIKEANAKGKVLQVKDVKRSDLFNLATEQLAILKDIQMHPELNQIPQEIVMWVQEVDTISRKILKLG